MRTLGGSLLLGLLPGEVLPSQIDRMSDLPFHGKAPVRLVEFRFHAQIEDGELLGQLLSRWHTLAASGNQFVDRVVPLCQ